MSSPLEYKGYVGTVDYSPEDKVFFGRLDGIRATVTYEGTNPESLERAFRDSVNDYLDLCKAQGIEAEKPYKGSFNIRIPKEVHRDLAAYARTHGMNLNGAARTAIEFLLYRHAPTEK